MQRKISVLQYIYVSSSVSLLSSFLSLSCRHHRTDAFFLSRWCPWRTMIPDDHRRVFSSLSFYFILLVFYCNLITISLLSRIFVPSSFFCDAIYVAEHLWTSFYRLVWVIMYLTKWQWWIMHVNMQISFFVGWFIFHSFVHCSQLQS